MIPTREQFNHALKNGQCLSFLSPNNNICFDLIRLSNGTMDLLIADTTARGPRVGLMIPPNQHAWYDMVKSMCEAQTQLKADLAAVEAVMPKPGPASG